MGNLQTVDPTSRRRTSLITQIIILSIVCIALFLVIRYLGSLNVVNKASDVIYRVYASEGSAHVKYTMKNGRDSELLAVETPWENRVVFNDWIDIYLIAGNDIEAGSVSCEILVNGRVVNKEEAIYPDNDKVGCKVILP